MLKMKRHQEDIICAFKTERVHKCPPLIISVSTSLRNLLNEASMAVMLGILFPLLFLLILPLVSPHVILPVLLPLLGLVYHLPPLALQLLCRELPISDGKNMGEMTGMY